MPVHRLCVVTVLAVVVASGCLAPERAPRATGDDLGSAPDPTSEGSQDESGAPDDGVDEAAVMERAFRYAEELVRANVEPESASHGDAATINYWAAPENLELFKTIDPERTDQQITFIDGAMFVKEHFDPDGAVIGMTVMYKGPPGYNSDANDWFFARVSEGSVTHQGAPGFCLDCHVMVENTDYVYGVAVDNLVD